MHGNDTLHMAVGSGRQFVVVDSADGDASPGHNEPVANSKYYGEGQ